MARQVTINGITISWHEGNGQWRKSIGFRPNKTGTRRVPAEWYLGEIEGVAAVHAAERLHQWKRICDGWDRLADAASVAYPKMPLELPFWFERKAEEAKEREGQVKAAVGVTLEDAVDLYLEAQEKRIRLIGPRKLKPYSYQTIAYTIKRAMLPIAADTLLTTITHADLHALVDHHYRADNLSERTAHNYCLAFKQFLDWLDSQTEIDFAMPKGANAVFERLRKPHPNPDIPEPSDLRTILHAATGPMRLWCLLALNCGCYEVDLAALPLGAVIQHKGHRCLWWKREKTSHQNTFKTLHWLFPETLAALDTHAQKDGDLLLRHGDGLALQVTTATTRRKIVSDRFAVLKNHAGYQFGFKGFRKFGANWLLNNSRKDGERIARLYLGQSLGGSLRNYARDEFDALTSELKRMHAALVKAKALPA